MTVISPDSSRALEGLHISNFSDNFALDVRKFSVATLLLVPSDSISIQGNFWCYVLSAGFHYRQCFVHSSQLHPGTESVRQHCRSKVIWLSLYHRTLFPPICPMGPRPASTFTSIGPLAPILDTTMAFVCSLRAPMSSTSYLTCVPLDSLSSTMAGITATCLSATSELTPS